MKKKHKRSLLVEGLEQRLLLDGAGLLHAPSAEWESVIVAVNDNVRDPAAVASEVAQAHGGSVGHIYEHAIKGFSVELPEAALEALAKNPLVKRIEPDLEMRAFDQTLPTGVDRIEADSNAMANIDGSDERVDVDVAIIDTGIDKDHPDLNVKGGRRFYTSSTGPPSQRGTAEDDNYDDDHGHGSHVAGTVGALDNDFGVVGVAPGAGLYGVKVLDASGSGYLSDIMAGIDWVTENADTIDVANMSLGGQGLNDSYHEAIQNSVEAGVVYVVAAGNDYRDILGDDLDFRTSDDTIPAAYPEVATISAISDSDGEPGGEGGPTSSYADDTFADFSNFSNSDDDHDSWYDANNLVTSPGLGIDLMMPGVDIYSTYKDGGYATYSGTSMASPHAAGLAALYIAEHGGATNANEVYGIRQALIDGGVPWRSENGLVSLDGDPLKDGESNADSPDKHEENLGWAVPLVEGVDVAITSVSAPSSVVEGETVDVSVTVENTGNQDVEDSFDVTLTGETETETDTIGTHTIDGLIAGNSTALTFDWDTTKASVGDHTLIATHDSKDDNPDNDSDSTVVSVESAITDLAVTSVESPSPMVQGDLVDVLVTVENTGNQDVEDSFDVT
ncbi:MAG: S8 family serine peptidase, partial [Planctomycetota bacterium]